MSNIKHRYTPPPIEMANRPGENAFCPHRLFIHGTTTPTPPLGVEDIDNIDRFKSDSYDPTYAYTMYIRKKMQENEYIITRNFLRPDDDSSGGLSNTEMIQNGIQYEITETMRVTLLNWLVMTTEEHRLSPATYALTIHLLDQVMAKYMPISKKRFQLVGCACLLLAAKIEELQPPLVEQLVQISDFCFEVDDLTSLERDLACDVFHFKLNMPTRYFFTARFARAAKMSKKETSFAHFITELSLYHVGFNRYPMSLVSAAAIHLTLQMMRPRCDFFDYVEDHIAQALKEKRGEKKVNSSDSSSKANSCTSNDAARRKQAIDRSNLRGDLRQDMDETDDLEREIDFGERASSSCAGNAGNSSCRHRGDGPACQDKIFASRSYMSPREQILWELENDMGELLQPDNRTTISSANKDGASPWAREASVSPVVEPSTNRQLWTQSLEYYTEYQEYELVDVVLQLREMHFYLSDTPQTDHIQNRYSRSMHQRVTMVGVLPLVDISFETRRAQLLYRVHPAYPRRDPRQRLNANQTPAITLWDHVPRTNHRQNLNANKGRINHLQNLNANKGCVLDELTSQHALSNSIAPTSQNIAMQTNDNDGVRHSNTNGHGNHQAQIHRSKAFMKFMQQQGEGIEADSDFGELNMQRYSRNQQQQQQLQQLQQQQQQQQQNQQRQQLQQRALSRTNGGRNARANNNSTAPYFETLSAVGGLPAPIACARPPRPSQITHGSTSINTGSDNRKTGVPRGRARSMMPGAETVLQAKHSHNSKTGRVSEETTEAVQASSTSAFSVSKTSSIAIKADGSGANRNKTSTTKRKTLPSNSTSSANNAPQPDNKGSATVITSHARASRGTTTKESGKRTLSRSSSNSTSVTTAPQKKARRSDATNASGKQSKASQRALAQLKQSQDSGEVDKSANTR